MELTGICWIFRRQENTEAEHDVAVHDYVGGDRSEGIHCSSTAHDTLDLGQILSKTG